MLKRHSSASKFILMLSALLLVYGGLARALDIYFFWESRWLGRNLLFIGLMMLLIERIRWLKVEAKSSILEKFGIVILGLAILFQVISFSMLQMNEAGSVGTDYLMQDEYVNQKVGNVNSALCYSGFAFKISLGGESGGVATLMYLVKGDDAFVEMPVVLAYKSDDLGWQVVEIPFEELEEFEFEYEDLD